MIRQGYYVQAIEQCTRSLDLIRPLLVAATDATFSVPSAGFNGPIYSNSRPAASFVAVAQQIRQDHGYDRQRERNIYLQLPTPQSPGGDPRISNDAAMFLCPTYDKDDVKLQAAAGGFVFRDPIEIPVNAVLKSHPTVRLYIKLSIVAMYNLALALHLNAIQTNDRIHLERARILYENAFQIHLDENCGDVTLLYSMALLNNLGLIYNALHEEQKSRNCFDNMLSAMMLLLESNEARNISQWSGFVINVSSLILSDRVASAA